MIHTIHETPFGSRRGEEIASPKTERPDLSPTTVSIYQ
jgi:hypothetical protein